MRIVHIITRMIIGGAQENTLLTCQGLHDLYGDEVILISGPERGPEGSLLDEVESRGRVSLDIASHLRREIRPWHDIPAYWQLRKLIRQHQPDVVHTHSAKAGILGRMAAYREKVPAIVHTVHGAPFYPYQSAIARHVYRQCELFAARRCHALVSVADAMTRILVDAGVPEDMFTTVYSGMDVEKFLAAGGLRDEYRRRVGLPEDAIVIGKVARLSALKGHEDFLPAMFEVARQNRNTHALLVGDGRLRTRIEQQILEAGLGERFHLVGLVEPSEVPGYLAAMDVVVHTSLREGLARVLPQALLAGRPVVSYDIDGAREVVIRDETGYLISPRAKQALVEAIVRLAADGDLRDRLAARGRELCREQFAAETMVRRLRSLYEKLLEQS